MPRLCPEVVGGEHGHGRQDAKTSGPKPDKSPEDDQYGAAELDDDGRSGPQPGRLQSEVRLLGDGSLKIEQLLDSAYEERRYQGDARERRKPGREEDRGDPAWGIGSRLHLIPPSRRNQARPRSS